jgi:hypothetical protein
VEGGATLPVAFVDIEVSACCVLADTADADDVALVAVVLGDIDVDGDGFGGGDIADDVAATFVVDCVEDNGADVVVGHTSATRMCTWCSDSSSNPVENVNFNECGSANRVTYQTVPFDRTVKLELTGINS